MGFEFYNSQLPTQARKRIRTGHTFTHQKRQRTSNQEVLHIQQHFAEIRSAIFEYSVIYTDGSKDGDRVASAAVFGHR
jgi:hypothetical protein